MTDPIAVGLAEFVLSRPTSPTAARHEAARRLLDVYSLAIASANDPAVAIARSLAQPTTGGATLWGAEGSFDLDGAALANGVATRYRDMNDAYFNRESLHPSDMVPVLTAVAETTDAPIATLLDAICVAYDVAVDLADTIRTSTRGADHVNLILLGAVAGAARLHDLDVERLAQAFAIAATCNVATRQTRRGRLTMWKGYAAAQAAVAGWRAVRMAAAGVQGPTLAFVGDNGFQALAVDPATVVDQWVRPDAGGSDWRILDTHLKVYPVGYLGQAAAELAISLHPRLDGEDPTEVRIFTYRRAAEIMADPEKWSLDSSETADHSLPWVAAVGLMDGRVERDSMSERRWDSDRARAVLSRVHVHVDEAMTAAYPDMMPLRLEATKQDGREVAAAVEWPSGHARRPLSDERLAARATGLMEPRLGDASARVTDALLRPRGDMPVPTLLREVGVVAGAPPDP